jgi:hypothetical protein
LDARTGHFDHDFSAAFEQLADFSLKMYLQKVQSALYIIVYKNPKQLDQILLVQYEVNTLSHFFHPSL